MAFFLWPTQSQFAYHLPVHLFAPSPIFRWPWITLWYMELFLRTPIGVASSYKGCLQIDFSFCSFRFSCHNGDQWSWGIRPYNFSPSHAHVAPVCRTGLLLSVTLTLKHIHVCLLAPCGQLSRTEATAHVVSGQNVPATHSHHYPLSISFGDPGPFHSLPKPHINLDLVPGHHGRNVIIGLPPRSAPIQPSLSFRHHCTAP